MTIETIRKSGILGLKEYHEEVAPGKTYSFILPPGNLRTVVSVVTADKITRCKDTDGNGSFKVAYLEEKQINRVNLLVPDRNGKPVRLKWKK